MGTNKGDGPGIVIEIAANIAPLLLGSIVVAASGYGLSLITPIPWWVPIAVLYLSAPLSLWRPFEAFAVRLLPNTRRARGAELATIVAALNRVNTRHHFPTRRWILTVEEGEHLNASTSGRHVLTLTRTALELPAPLLDAVVAHELAHQAGGDTVVKAFRWWFLFPVQALAKILRITAWGAVAFSFLGVLQVIFAAVLTAMLYALTIPVLAMLPLNAIVERRNEFAADRYAAQAGFRDELVALLTGFEPVDGTQPSIWGRITSSHPPIEARLQALHNM